jgi:hypothetical protein
MVNDDDDDDDGSSPREESTKRVVRQHNNATRLSRLFPPRSGLVRVGEPSMGEPSSETSSIPAYTRRGSFRATDSPKAIQGRLELQILTTKV